MIRVVFGSRFLFTTTVWFSACALLLMAAREEDEEMSMAVREKDKETTHMKHTCNTGYSTNSCLCSKREKDLRGCVNCDTMDRYGYTLFRRTDDPVKNKTSRYILTAKGGGTAQVRLPAISSDEAKKAAGRNCFGFATHQAYTAPGDLPSLVSEHGNSPVHNVNDVNADNFRAAMELEGAIWLGRDDAQLQSMALTGKVKADTEYYLVAAILKGGEYHFWGLWNNGWYATPSLTSAKVDDLGELPTTGYHGASRNCPSWHIFEKFLTKGSNFWHDQGGFYLFPLRKLTPQQGN